MKLSEKLLRNYKHGLYSVVRDKDGKYLIFSQCQVGDHYFNYTDSRASLQEATDKIGYYLISFTRIEEEGSSGSWKIVDTMQPWQTMGTELFPVGTYVEILTGNNKGDITKIKSHEDVGGTTCYVLACDEEFFYGQDQLKPVLSKWLVSNEVEEAIALLKREGVIKDGQILTTL